MSDANAYWLFTTILMIMLMVFFGQFIYREYWAGYWMPADSPGAPPTRNYIPLNQNPIVMDV
jgi:hypothetical protein